MPVAPEDQNVLLIDFPDESAAQAGLHAGELERYLQDEAYKRDAVLSADRVRLREEASDLGTAIPVILGTKAVIAVAYGIKKLIERNSGVKIRITTKNGSSIEFDHLNSSDVPATVQRLQSLKDI